MIDWNSWALTGIGAAVVAWLMAWFMFRSMPDRALAWRTSVLMSLEGAAVLTSGAAAALLVTSQGGYRAVALVHYGVDWLLLALYLPFLAHALDVRVLRVFKKRMIEVGLVAAGIVGALSVAVVPQWYLGDVIALSGGGYFHWVSTPGPVWSYLAGLLGLLFLCGFCVSVLAWRRAKADLSRSRARAFALAFGSRAFVWGGIYMLFAFAAARLTVESVFYLLQLYALTLLVYTVLVSYGVLTTQLFDIDLRLKWTVRQSSIAAAFVAVFFLVSEGVKTFLSVQFGNLLGIAAAAVLVFFLAPLRRMADGIANLAVPQTQTTSNYEAFRKLQIYHAALEGAYSDGQIRPKERLILDRLKAGLEIADVDAERLELDIRRMGHEAMRQRGLVVAEPDA